MRRACEVFDEDLDVTAMLRGHGRGIGMDAERREYHVWTVRDGAITRFDWFYGREDALSAAGLAGSGVHE